MKVFMSGMANISLAKNLVVRQANQESACHFNIISSYIESLTKLLPLKELQARKY